MSIGHFRSKSVWLPVPANCSVSFNCVIKNVPLTLSNLTVVWTFLTRLSPSLADTVASLPPSAIVPFTTTLGAVI